MPQALKRPLRILCVEDDPTIAGLLVQLFAREGHWVVYREGGQAAWRHLTEESACYDVIVTDHQMPAGGGLELVTRLRGAGFAHRVVVHSSPPASEQLASYRQFGVRDFVSKGATAAALLRAVDAFSSDR